MHAGKFLLAVGVVTAVIIAGLLQGRSDAKFDRLAIRVDSLAVSLTTVVDAVDASRPAPQPDTIDIGA